MFNNLTALGYGIVAFAVVLGIGMAVTQKFASAIAECPSGYAYETNGTAGVSYTTGLCCSTTASQCTGAGNFTPITNGATNVRYIQGQMGSSGLAGWAPAIIALAVGLLFLGAFIAKKGKQY